jgi:hypothetical protein
MMFWSQGVFLGQTIDRTNALPSMAMFARIAFATEALSKWQGASVELAKAMTIAEPFR